MAIKLILLLMFGAVTIFMGFYFRKRARSVDDFVLGGRKVGPWFSAFAYGTSYFSAVVFVGYAGQFGWKLGTSVLWVAITCTFIGTTMPWLILARRTRLMTQHLKSSTMPEFFGARFMSAPLKIGASIIIFIFMIPYTAGLYNGLSRLFAMAFHLDFEYIIIAMALITGIYVVVGGYLATVANDLFHGAIMLVGIVIINIVALNAKGGFTEALHALARVNTDEAATVPGIFISFFGPDPLTLFGIIALTAFGTWGLPQMISKFYAIKSEKMISKGTVVSSVFSLIVCGGCYLLGSFGRLYADVIERRPDGAIIYDSIIPTIISQFSDLMIGMVILLVFAASISTLSSLVMVSASTLTLDFLKGHVIKKMDDKKQLLIIRGLILVFIVISVIISIFQFRKGSYFIAQLIGISWGGMAGSFLAPFLYGLYWKRVSKVSVWCCFIFSTALMALNIFFRSSFPAILQSPINAGALAVLAGLVIVPVVSMLTKAPDKVEDFFTSVE